MRLEQEVNIYGDAEILKRFQAAETSISVVQGNISALISESEIIELQNSHTTMYSQMASLKLSVSDLILDFSDLQTKYNTVTGQYTDLSSRVAQYKASVDGLSADITAVEQNLSKNYSTTTAMNAAIKASVDGLSATVSKTYATTTQLNAAKDDAVSTAKSYTDSAKSSALTTARGYADAAEAAANKATDEKLTEYSTTEEMQAAIDLKVDEINLSVSNTYATTSSVTEKFNNAVQKGQQAADAAEAAANQNTTNKLKNYSTTTQMNAAIKAKADEITLEVNKKVDSSEFGTKISQNAYYVRVAWNGNSKYIQFENGGISMYDGAVETSKRRAVFNYSGEHFYRDGYYVGKIGTNHWEDNNTHKGLVFDLEVQGKFMTWARKKSASDDTYAMI